MAIAIRTIGIPRSPVASAQRTTRAAESLRTECLTPMAVTLGIVMWAAIILIVRHFA
jgi:hypothetical protein